MLRTDSYYSIFFKVNVLFTTFLYLVFLNFHQFTSFYHLVLIILAMISTSITLSAIFYILLYPFKIVKKIQFFITILVFIFTNISLLIDFIIYKIYKFHINAMVINIITSPKAFDSIQIGLAPFISFGVFIIFLILFQIILIKQIYRINIKSITNLNAKINRLIILPLFLIIFSEKTAYATASLLSDNRTISKFKIFPLYQPLTANRLIYKLTGYKSKQQTKNIIDTDAMINYPLSTIDITQAKKIPIFIFALDAVRYSVLNKETAPNITNFQKDSISFVQHLSGGNATRFGIFSLFYSLNSTYWFPFLNAVQSPVLIDTLVDLDYKFNIISSTSTKWPEFDKTIYVKIQDSIYDNFNGAPWEKDKQNSEKFLQLMDNYIDDKPIFSFVFLDAPHGYSYPPHSNEFNSSIKGKINFLKVEKDSPYIAEVFASYKNAIHYDDSLFGKMIAKLKEKGLYEKSIIIVTSDHGEEFYEYGFFGHNTSFSPAQTHIPFIIKLPEDMQKNIELPQNYPNIMTSHLDFAPTLLSLLGIKNDAQDYANGYNIFDKNYTRDYVYCANWNNNAIITEKNTYIFSNLPNKIFTNQVRDTKTYTEQKDVNIKPQLLLKVMNNNKKFLK